MKIMSIIKFLGLGLVVTIVSIIGLALLVGDTSPEEPTVVIHTESEVSEEAEAKEETLSRSEVEEKQRQVQEFRDSLKITLEEFNQIEDGMTKDQVEEIIGGHLTLVSESGSVKIYGVDGIGGYGANAVFMFDHELLYAKSQVGLGGN